MPGRAPSPGRLPSRDTHAQLRLGEGSNVYEEPLHPATPAPMPPESGERLSTRVSRRVHGIQWHGGDLVVHCAEGPVRLCEATPQLDLLTSPPDVTGFTRGWLRIDPGQVERFRRGHYAVVRIDGPNGTHASFLCRGMRRA